jgi:hypothetical protein
MTNSMANDRVALVKELNYQEADTTSISNGPQVKTMQGMWSVFRENGQMSKLQSNLQGALPTEIVSSGAT